MGLPATLQPLPFPAGVADAGGKRAALCDRAGRMLAVALDDGKLLWRTADALRPLCIASDEVLAWRAGSAPACVAVAWAGTQAGRTIWASDPIPLPAWVSAASAGSTFTVAAEVAGDSIELRWVAHARYRGGAAPGPRVLAQNTHDGHGAVSIHRASGRVQVRPDGSEPAPAMEPIAAAGSPDVLAHADIGQRRYELCVEGAESGTVRTLLRARSLDSDGLLWVIPIDEVPRTPPRALRA